MASDRRLEGFVIALIWVIGVELFPLFHLALHAWLPAHEHGVHHHGDVAHADHATDEKPDGDGDHGDGSLAHRDLAAGSGAVDALAFGQIYVLELGSVPPKRAPILTARRTRAPARAPPAESRFFS